MDTQPNTPQDSKEKIKQGSTDLITGVVDFFRELVDLSTDLDREGTIINIQNNKRMKGANAWLLMCSIMVASLGLNLNSPAVIIGAMLISPLMSPILGIGLSVGINDKQGFFIALQHFGLSIAIALVTSVIYFKMTPLDIYTSEINARTEPTFLDVLVAVFGGLAGIISGSRMDKSNAIPGVAIATALMPPLCVTGYGLANGDWVIVLNSFYLFFMNSTFIALTTYLIVRLLRFPKKKYEKKAERKRTQLIMVVFALLMLLPSIYLFYNVVQNVRERTRVEEYIESHFPTGIKEMKLDKRTDTLNVEVFVFEDLSEEYILQYAKEFEALNCKAKLTIIDAKDSGISKTEFDNIKNNLEYNHTVTLEKETNALRAEKDKQIIELKNQLDSLSRDTVIFNSASQELHVLYPELEEIRYAKMQSTQQDSTTKIIPTFLLKWSKKKTNSTKNRDEEKIENFLKIRENLQELQIVRF